MFGGTINKQQSINIFGKDYTEKDLREILSCSNDYDIYLEGGKETDYICDNSEHPFFVIYYYKVCLKSDPSKYKYIYTEAKSFGGKEEILFDED